MKSFLEILGLSIAAAIILFLGLIIFIAMLVDCALHAHRQLEPGPLL